MVKKKVDEDNTIAVICVANGRVVGLLVSRERACLRQVELSSFEADHLGSWRPATGQRVESHRRRSIDMIWVLRAKRRQGIAKSLAEALAQHCDMRIEDIAHMVPFREEALRLWIGLKQSTIYVV